MDQVARGNNLQFSLRMREFRTRKKVYFTLSGKDFRDLLREKGLVLRKKVDGVARELWSYTVRKLVC